MINYTCARCLKEQPFSTISMATTKRSRTPRQAAGMDSLGSFQLLPDILFIILLSRLIGLYVTLVFQLTTIRDVYSIHYTFNITLHTQFKRLPGSLTWTLFQNNLFTPLTEHL